MERIGTIRKIIEHPLSEIGVSLLISGFWKLVLLLDVIDLYNTKSNTKCVAEDALTKKA